MANLGVKNLEKTIKGLATLPSLKAEAATQNTGRHLAEQMEYACQVVCKLLTLLSVKGVGVDLACSLVGEDVADVSMLTKSSDRFNETKVRMEVIQRSGLSVEELLGVSEQVAAQRIVALLSDPNVSPTTIVTLVKDVIDRTRGKAVQTTVTVTPVDMAKVDLNGVQESIAASQKRIAQLQNQRKSLQTVNAEVLNV